MIDAINPLGCFALVFIDVVVWLRSKKEE